MFYMRQGDHPVLEEDRLLLTYSSDSVVLETVQRRHLVGAQ